MTKVRVAGFGISVDGFGAGPEQSLSDPLGKNGNALHPWLLGTRTFRTMFGQEGGTDGVDEDYAARSMAGFGETKFRDIGIVWCSRASAALSTPASPAAGPV